MTNRAATFLKSVIIGLRISLFLIVLVAIACAGSFWYWKSNIEPRKYIQFTMGEATYRIPRSFNFVASAPGPNGILINTIYPYFVPDNELPLDVGNSHVNFVDFVTIFAIPKARVKPFDQALHMRMENYKQLRRDGSFHGLDRYTQQLSLNDSIGDFYIETENNSPVSYIECRLERQMPNATCSMFFIDHDLDYQLSFNRGHLVHWYDIKRKSLSLIASFVEQGSSNTR